MTPVCPDCGIKGKKFITSLARLYDPAMAEVSAGATRLFWTGEYFCPKCNKILTPKQNMSEELTANCPICGKEYKGLPDIPLAKRLRGHLTGKHCKKGEELEKLMSIALYGGT